MKRLFFLLLILAFLPFVVGQCQELPNTNGETDIRPWNGEGTLIPFEAYWIRGLLTDGTNNYADTCIDQTHLTEYYCSDDVIQQTNQLCWCENDANGFGACVEGCFELGDYIYFQTKGTTDFSPKLIKSCNGNILETRVCRDGILIEFQDCGNLVCDETSKSCVAPDTSTIPVNPSSCENIKCNQGESCFSGECKKIIIDSKSECTPDSLNPKDTKENHFCSKVCANKEIKYCDYNKNMEYVEFSMRSNEGICRNNECVHYGCELIEKKNTFCNGFVIDSDRDGVMDNYDNCPGDDAIYGFDYIQSKLDKFEYGCHDLEGEDLAKFQENKCVALNGDGTPNKLNIVLTACGYDEESSHVFVRLAKKFDEEIRKFPPFDKNQDKFQIYYSWDLKKKKYKRFF